MDQRILAATVETIPGLIQENVKLGDNFSLGEFLVSQTAARRGIDNRPNPEQLRCLYLLTQNVLQPIRNLLKVPIRISSGLRVPELNTAIGASSTSQHIRGQAADFSPIGPKSLVDYCRVIAKSNIPFDQLILEFHTLSQPNSGWIHVSYNPGREKQRRSILTIDKSGVRVGIDPK